MNNMISSVEASIDPKIIYLIKTLSRTKRKDYENYVINAIWNRLSNPDIEIVTQQFVKNKFNSNGKHFFIDMYFPTLNIGIECNEPFHLNQAEQDREREVSIFDAFYGIDKEDYKAYKIEINVETKFHELEEQINNIVSIINRAIELTPESKWKWKISAYEYFEDKEILSVKDRKGFRTINEACNIIFNGNRKPTGGPSKGYFGSTQLLGKTDYKDYKLWFPQLALEIKDEKGKKGFAAAPSGWFNQLLEDGVLIQEKIKGLNKPNDKSRIVFAKSKNALGINEYKFIGCFKYSNSSDEFNFYRRFSDKINIVKPS